MTWLAPRKKIPPPFLGQARDRLDNGLLIDVRGIPRPCVTTSEGGTS
jgi:hypothetical protein